MTGTTMPAGPGGRHRDAVDVARVLALALVVTGHLLLAVIDRVDGAIRGANLVELHPGWAPLLAVAPMPVFFAAGGYANATASWSTAARRLTTLAGLASVVVVAWSLAVAVAVVVNGEPGIVGRGARLATQPLWFVAAYAPFAALGRPLARLAGHHPWRAIGGCLVALIALDVVRFVLDGPRWIGWIGFPVAWGVPWLLGGWWRQRVEAGTFREARTGAALAGLGLVGALVLVHGFGYSPALIDAVPGARSNTTPPTLYTAVAGVAQTGVVLVLATGLDRIGRRWRPLWDRAGQAAVGIYAWHLTALSLCSALIAAGLPAPERLTLTWWLTRPLWWLAVITLASGFVLATDATRRRLRRRAPTTPERSPASWWSTAAGVVALTAAGAAVGLEGPRSLPMATAWSVLFVLAWWCLRRGGSAATDPAAPVSRAGRP